VKGIADTGFLVAFARSRDMAALNRKVSQGDLLSIPRALLI
jgi:hypothetical protein